MLGKLIAKCESLANQFSPRKNIGRKRKSSIPRHRRILIRKSRKLQKMYQYQRGQVKHATKAKLSDIERQLQHSYQIQEQHDETKAVAAIKCNSKYFYSYARKKRA